MKNALFTFTKADPNSMVVSNQIARFVSQELGLTLFDDEKITDEKHKNLIIIGGMTTFSKHLASAGKAIYDAERVIMIQNDYSIPVPPPHSVGDTPYRKGIGDRHREGRRPMDFWTTCEKWSQKTPDSRYINWNSMTYFPLDQLVVDNIRKDVDDNIFYYGAYRVGRKKYFDRFFSDPIVETIISCPNDKFKEVYPNVLHDARIPSGNFFEHLTTYGMGLYLEDTKSHTEFHSPANRFYEMLSAQLPMCFQAESWKMMKQAGFDIKKYIVKDSSDIKELMKHREEIRQEQHELWHKPYRQQLITRMHELFEEIQ